MATSKLCFCFIFLLFILISALVTDGQENNMMGTTNHRSDGEVMALFNSWLLEHEKAYDDSIGGEKETRFEIFKDNLRFIDEHNAQNHLYKLGLNRFADLSHEESRSKRGRVDRRTPFVENNKNDRYAYEATSDDGLPESIDWRKKGAVTPVKNQGSDCESSWAFSAIGAVEGINQIETGKLIPLSAQQLLDFDRSYNGGCNGGLVHLAFDFIIENGGITTEKDYPYHGVNEHPDESKKNAHVVSINGWDYISTSDEMILKKVVAHQPVSIAIDSSRREFDLYKSGIYTGPCGTSVDHMVLVVGYGSENGVDYWIVKNSWDVNWGENGYMRIERNVADKYGRCGVTMDAFYPIKNSNQIPSPSVSTPPSTTPIVSLAPVFDAPSPSPSSVCSAPSTSTLTASPVTSPYSSASTTSPGTVCDDYYQCPKGATCCCTYQFGDTCFAWGCCPLDSATCCGDHSSCCPSDYPICDTDAGTCLMSKDNPMQVKARKQGPATSIWSHLYR